MKVIKLFLFFLFTLVNFSCVNEPKFFDEKHKTIYFNNISISEGKDRIVEELKRLGFKEVSSIEPSTIDTYSYPTHYTRFECSDLKSDISNQITYNLFNFLNNGFHTAFVFIEWDNSGNIINMSIGFNETIDEQKQIYVNKKLLELFPYKKTGNKMFGYKTYYNDNVELYYTNMTNLSFRFK